MKGQGDNRLWVLIILLLIGIAMIIFSYQLPDGIIKESVFGSGAMCIFLSIVLFVLDRMDYL